MKTTILKIGLAFLLFLPSVVVYSHCDTMDGPIITAAKDALNSGNVNLVLLWVQKPDEVQIRELFDRTVKLRKQGGELKDLADLYFFENLVRIHRAGEGAPYTGLKPAGQVEPSIAAADKAIEAGNLDNLIKSLNEEVMEGVKERFQQVMDKKNYDKNNPDAGREFVEKYVIFIHYVEGIFKSVELSTAHNEKHSESGENTSGETCKHDKGTSGHSDNSTSQEGNSCSTESGSCDHATHIIMIVSILNLIGLIAIFIKLRKLSR